MKIEPRVLLTLMACDPDIVRAADSTAGGEGIGGGGGGTRTVVVKRGRVEVGLDFLEAVRDGRTETYGH